MKPLAMELTKGAKRQLQSIGWKTPEGENAQLEFYAQDENGRPLVIELKPALPRFYCPGVPVVYTSRMPLPKAVCIEISPCRLLPPPCYQSEEEFKSQLPGHYAFGSWEAAYVETHGEIWVLSPEDDKPLQKRLDDWLAAMRDAGDKPIDGVPCKGRLNLNLEGVKRGFEGIRDTYLHEQWAKEKGEDLNLMARERRVFCKWLQENTGTPAQDVKTGKDFIALPRFGLDADEMPPFQEACAKVRYRARFGDNADTVVYLRDCEVRPELTALEIDELTKMRAVSETPQHSQVVSKWHSSNYRQLFWTDNGQVMRANLTKKQASAISALHHAPGFVLARDEWQQEIYGDSPPDDFRPDKIFAYNDSRKVWDRFISVEGDRYRLVIERE